MSEDLFKGLAIGILIGMVTICILAMVTGWFTAKEYSLKELQQIQETLCKADEVPKNLPMIGGM